MGSLAAVNEAIQTICFLGLGFDTREMLPGIDSRWCIRRDGPNQSNAKIGIDRLKAMPWRVAVSKQWRGDESALKRSQ